METFSFLPKGQGDRRDLGRQGAAGPFGFHPRGYPRRLEIFARSGGREGRGGGGCAARLAGLVVIGMQPQDQGWLARARPWAVHHPVVGAGAGPQRQARVGPPRPLTAQALRGWPPGDQPGDPPRAERGEAAQHLLGGVRATLGQPGGARLLAPRPAQVPWLLEPSGATPPARLEPWLPPLAAPARRVDADSRPAYPSPAIPGLPPVHHPRRVAHQGALTAGRFPPRRPPRVAVIDRFQRAPAQPLGQLAGVEPSALLLSQAPGIRAWIADHNLGHLRR